MKRLIALVAMLAIFAPLAARAQSDQDLQIRGRVSSFDGGYGLVVRDEQGYLDNVELHPGTIINPTGMNLQPGMVVSVIGYNAGPSINANEIDTPYVVTSGIPFYQGHPWTYFGIGVGIGLFFGSLAWWHGNDFAGGYRFVNGRRIWGRVDTARIFHGGAFHGRDYVAVGRAGWNGHGVAMRPGIDRRFAADGHRDAFAHGNVLDRHDAAARNDDRHALQNHALGDAPRMGDAPRRSVTAAAARPVAHPVNTHK
jgi:hypothetical protein